MYESITYEDILERMLSRVPDTLDKREGSVIYTALAPAAAELQNMYLELDVVLNETFADTATMEYLVRRAAERGLTPYPATYAELKGVFDTEIPIGARFSLDDLNYTAAEKLADGEYRMRCETAGAAGNQKLGTLLPVDYIDGLTRAELTQVLIAGEDEEDEEHLRQRYMDSFRRSPCGGNIDYYRETVNALQDVGAVKVYPVWNGGGTVKLVLLNASYRRPSTELIASVQAQVDPEEGQGNGMGLAPIGHTVTVAAANETAVNIEMSITYAQGWNWAELKSAAEQAVDAYFAELGKLWESEEFLIVRINQLESRLLALEGIVDIENTRLNGNAGNLTLCTDCIPVRGTVNG